MRVPKVPFEALWEYVVLWEVRAKCFCTLHTVLDGRFSRRIQRNNTAPELVLGGRGIYDNLRLDGVENHILEA